MSNSEIVHAEECEFATGKGRFCTCGAAVEWLKARSKPGHGCDPFPCDECRADGWIPISEALPGGRYDGILEENGLELRRD